MEEKSFYNRPRKTGNSPIAAKRIARGLTQAQLAKLMGVCTSQVSGWELGSRVPSGKSLIKLSNALECSIDELMSVK